MFDFSKEKIEINCPSCNSVLAVTFGQISKEDSVSCKSCKNKIKLIDKNNVGKKIDKSLRDLEKTLKNFGS
ncbi:hypothetical protein [Putridiphycobacter roseus]|uniref:hypothetical protein n=1 Tax=Putridiphycobacter roseus TaxID=2219161 RepID=UPI0011B49F52|nr:hypothetical protein [Putridiphycobacter roseus]